MSNIVIPDGGNIGSASDPDAISIASSGKPTFSQGIANTGTIDAGTLGSSVVVPASVGSSTVLIKTITASNGDTEILFQHNSNGVVLDSTYTIYMLLLSGIVPTTNGKNVYMQVGSSGGYDTGCRGGYHNWYDNGSSTGGASGSLNSSYFWNSQGNALYGGKQNGGLAGIFMLHNLSDAAYATHATFSTIFFGSNAYYYGMTGSTTTVNEYTVDRIKFLTDSDSFQGGSKISLYGIKDA